MIWQDPPQCDGILLLLYYRLAMTFWLGTSNPAFALCSPPEGTHADVENPPRLLTPRTTHAGCSNALAVVTVTVPYHTVPCPVPYLDDSLTIGLTNLTLT